VRNTPALLLVPVLLAGCGGGGSSASTGSATTTGAPDAQTVTVGMGDDLKFHPSTIEARRGSVSFDVSNTGQVPHDLIFDDKALGGTKTVDGKSAVTLKVSFPAAGTFTFVCTFHPGMTGKVVVS
jgi:plastocyanin